MKVGARPLTCANAALGLTTDRRAADFLVVGGGVVGLAIALELRRRHPDQRVVVLDKEARCGEHASGRNSGVVHAGFYYTADSLKARFTVEGNRRLTRYCEERGLPLNRCGKLVVARNEAELGALAELARRGAVNGVELRTIDAAEVREIEPRARTHERALWSPNTSSLDPGRVMEALAEDAAAAGIEIRCGVAFQSGSRDRVRTTDGDVTAGYVVNAAGLYADRVARCYGFSEGLRVLPFKGLYLYSDEPAGSLRTNIYPVPDLANPFLGVHFTVTVEGRAKIGPTAVPAFWRENYGGLQNFNARELVDVVGREAGLFLRDDFGFRSLALRELRKHHRPTLIRQASELARIEASSYRSWGRPGIRAQLLDTRTRRLVMDFVVEGDDRSFHVLNAVSPAFTCALPFATHVVTEIEKRVA
jgi:(S)-2-hydroxyglutarate dehydrogenase